MNGTDFGAPRTFIASVDVQRYRFPTKIGSRTSEPEVLFRSSSPLTSAHAVHYQTWLGTEARGRAGPDARSLFDRPAIGRFGGGHYAGSRNAGGRVSRSAH